MLKPSGFKATRARQIAVSLTQRLQWKSIRSIKATAEEEVTARGTLVTNELVTLIVRIGE